MQIQSANKSAESSSPGADEDRSCACDDDNENARMRPSPTAGSSSEVSEATNHIRVIDSDQAGEAAAEKPRSRKSRGAYELKFLIDEAHALEIMGWAREHLDADPHFDPELGDGYLVNSLYLDSPKFDVFHRMEGFRQQKFRLRRYGREDLVWFEQKRKRKGLVRKKRVAVDEPDISNRLVMPSDPAWDGIWFRDKVDEQQLRPVCQITYRRFARVKPTDDGHMRLTIDDRLTARLADGWQVPKGQLEGVGLLDGKRILELKFRGAMPTLFRGLVEQQQLQVTSFSKYRTGVEECVPLDALVGDDSQGPANA